MLKPNLAKERVNEDGKVTLCVFVRVCVCSTSIRRTNNPFICINIYQTNYIT